MEHNFMEIDGYTIKDGVAFPNDNMILYKKNKFYKNIGIPNKYINSSLEDFSINQDAFGNELNQNDKNLKSKAYNICKKYIKEIKEIVMCGEKLSTKEINNKMFSSQNLILKGSSGSGKTLLSILILKSCIEITTNVVFCQWNDFYNILSNFEYKEDANSLEEKFINSDFAIVDGITNYAYTKNTFFQRKIENICSKRLTGNKPMIWTSYVPAIDLFNMFGPISQSFISDCIIISLPSGSNGEFFKEA
jgi:DNA replication protein DnaC